MATFTLPLPPTSNHAYRPAVRRRRDGTQYSRMLKTDALEAWQQEAALVRRGWEPPDHTRLAVRIVLHIPKRLHRRIDVDGPVKCLLDSLLGARGDQWVDHLEVEKVVGDGHAEVTVEVMTEQKKGEA